MGWREGGSAERPATFFDGPEDFRAWLAEHHDTATELWMGLHKRHVPEPERGLTWHEAVPVALCFGWIDSVSQRIDDDARRQRWTPRRPGSVWSAVNVAHVERLLAEGLMEPAGIAAFEARTAERTAVYAYERQTELTDEQAAALEADPAAAAFWSEAPASYRKVWRRGCATPSRRPHGSGGCASSSRTARPDASSPRRGTARCRVGSIGPPRRAQQPLRRPIAEDATRRARPPSADRFRRRGPTGS